MITETKPGLAEAMRGLLQALKEEREAFDKSRHLQIKGAARRSWQQRARQQRVQAEKTAETTLHCNVL